MPITGSQIKILARDCGFELAGVADALPLDDYHRFERWRSADKAGSMTYLTDHRGTMRSDPRSLLPSAQSVICVGKLYNNPGLHGMDTDRATGTISRYAVGEDYHVIMRTALQALQDKIAEAYGAPIESRVCVDTAPLLERSLARKAGLGWIGKNTCLINQEQGSWFFLGELLLSIPIAPDVAPPDRCGTCRRCIDACPTAAIMPDPAGGSQLDARVCISYLTIEHRGEWPADLAPQTGNHIFGCDICQEVCPWNRDAAETAEPAFQPRSLDTTLVDLATYSPEDFKLRFRNSPLWRAHYSGFLRNVAAAMGNAGTRQMEAPLRSLANSEDAIVANTARESLARLMASQPMAPEEL